MLEAYSLNVTAAANANIPFNSVSIQKGCTATKSAVDTINLNICGVYLVAVDLSAGASTTIQLVKDGVLQPQAQSTGTSPSFTTLVQVDHNNSCCACDSPTVIQVRNTTATTLTDANITVTKVV